MATAAGIVASETLDLSLLEIVGISDRPYWVQNLATGLIPGAGTKPLRDLVGYIKKKKESAGSAASQPSR